MVEGASSSVAREQPGGQSCFPQAVKAAVPLVINRLVISVANPV